MTAALGNLPVSFRIERSHDIEHGVLEVRRYFWSGRVEQTIEGIGDALVLNMALTSRPAMTRVDRLNEDRLAPHPELGRLLIMMPGAPYHLSAPTGAFRSFNCTLECRKFEQIIGERIDWRALEDLGGELGPGTMIEQHLTRMYEEMNLQTIGWKAVVESCATTLCVELYRRFRQGRPMRPDVLQGGLSTWRMRLLAERVHAEKPAPSVSELAELCGLTTRQLSRAFKAETGRTLGRYVDEATMERAHRLLTTTNLSIAAIAQELGFASPDSFAQSFRRVTGSPPTHARRR